jgi:hypothetical protein
MKVGNPTNVLDGDIDGLLEAYLRWTLSEQTAPAADELE